MSTSPIGIFDSGVGGLTIMREIMRQLPQESLIYLADTKRLPYGNQDADTIIRYSLECGQFLHQLKVKILVVACNTATAYALPFLEKKLQIPVIGVIESTAKKAASITSNCRIAILATQATINSKAYEKSILSLLPQATLISLACPLFVPLVEEGFFTHPVTQLIVQEYLKNLHTQQIDTLLLGCTHYPFLKPIIQKEIGTHVSLIDSTVSCTEHLNAILNKNNLGVPIDHSPTHCFYVSGDPIKFKQIGERFLKADMSHIQNMSFYSNSIKLQVLKHPLHVKT